MTVPSVQAAVSPGVLGCREFGALMQVPTTRAADADIEAVWARLTSRTADRGRGVAWTMVEAGWRDSAITAVFDLCDWAVRQATPWAVGVAPGGDPVRVLGGRALEAVQVAMSAGRRASVAWGWLVLQACAPVGQCGDVEDFLATGVSRRDGPMDRGDLVVAGHRRPGWLRRDQWWDIGVLGPLAWAAGLTLVEVRDRLPVERWCAPLCPLTCGKVTGPGCAQAGMGEPVDWLTGAPGRDLAAVAALRGWPAAAVAALAG